MKALVDAQRERVLGLTAFGAAGGDISAVKIAKLRSCTGAARRGSDRPTIRRSDPVGFVHSFPRVTQ